MSIAAIFRAAIDSCSAVYDVCGHNHAAVSPLVAVWARMGQFADALAKASGYKDTRSSTAGFIEAKLGVDLDFCTSSQPAQPLRGSR